MDKIGVDELVIDLGDYTHVKELSDYNNNVYNHKSSFVQSRIRIKCHEDYDFLEINIIDPYDKNEVFLGCSQDYLSDGLIRIDFLKMYT